MFIGKITDIAHELIQDKIHEGDTVVDATVGNGYDTIFLLNLVGQTGKVIGFDIQFQALEQARKNINQTNLHHCVQLIHDSHENMKDYIHGAVQGVVFNLGYLPGGDQTIITRPDSTVSSLCAAASLLDSRGWILLVSYRGHKGGEEERQAVEKELAAFDQKKFSVVKIDFINMMNQPPILYFLQKK